jgi:hypothetical protein
MIFDKFVKEIHELLHEYFCRIYELEKSGGLDNQGQDAFYPNVLLVVNCSGYYVAELIGANLGYKGLSVKRHTEKSIYRYFNAFHEGGEVKRAINNFGSGPASVYGLSLSNVQDRSKLHARFPVVELCGTVIIYPESDGFYGFSDDFISASLQRIILISQKLQLYRMKHILGAFVFRSNADRGTVEQHLKYYLDQEYVSVVASYTSERSRMLTVSAQLQSLYMLDKVHETTIGEFIRHHPDIIKRALGTDYFLYEPSFSWLEHDGTCEDQSINPDLMVRRADGYFDIYDLKTALLEKKLTKKKRRRRAFVEAVYDGVNQLGNYREYFTYGKNAEHALSRHGVAVKNPRLTLVVGSWENYDSTEVAQACRMIPDLEIIDYDTLIQQFLNAATFSD